LKHLTKDQIEEIKDILLNWKKQILEDAKENIGEPLSYEGGDEIDRADTEAERFLTLRMLDKERKLLKKIEYSLAKIEAGTYGLCEMCDTEIPFERLKARPVANLCIKCKEIQEENE